jgi:hypothetical protein
MRLGAGRGIGVLALAAWSTVACGQSSAGHDTPEACRPSSPEAQQADALPARLDGTLCSESDELALSIPREAEDPALGIVHLGLTHGNGSIYTVKVLAYVDGVLVPVPNSTESSTFELSVRERDAYFIPYFLDYDDERMTLALSGSEGRVILEVDRPALAPSIACSGEYEGLPVDTPPLSLPADVELELCNARDSRAWAVTVAAGRAVEVTVENPESMDTFSLGAYRNQNPVEPFPVTDGANQGYLGLATKGTFSFVPAEAGIVAFHASSGFSRGEPSRLHIAQP